jgi:hypothetical protein
LHHGHEAKIGSKSMKSSMLPPEGLSYDHLQTSGQDVDIHALYGGLR